jgi:hypothetical protein
LHANASPFAAPLVSAEYSDRLFVTGVRRQMHRQRGR